MLQPGDQIFLGRYLATGADESSVFLSVSVGVRACVCVWHDAVGTRCSGRSMDQECFLCTGGSCVCVRVWWGTGHWAPARAASLVDPSATSAASSLASFSSPTSVLPALPCPAVQVEEVTATEVICSACADAVLDGLLMVFHLERSGGAWVESSGAREVAAVCWAERKRAGKPPVAAAKQPASEPASKQANSVCWLPAAG